VLEQIQEREVERQTKKVKTSKGATGKGKKRNPEHVGGRSKGKENREGTGNLEDEFSDETKEVSPTKIGTSFRG